MYFGAINEMPEYFASNGVDIPESVNPAERMIDIVSESDRDWAEVWLSSEHAAARAKELEELKEASKGKAVETDDDRFEYASTTWIQLRLVTKRASVQVSRCAPQRDLRAVVEEYRLCD